MIKTLKLPVGIEDFKEIREEAFYYVDKTGLIEQLLLGWSKVNLFTRPRRFGKSLNMSMLQNFFEIGCKTELFDGLNISNNADLCKEYMGKYPVVSISMKSVDANSYDSAKAKIVKIINREARRLQFLLDSKNITSIDRELFKKLLCDNMNEEAITCSLQELTELLEKHYQKKVIVLIDEYDVPLDKAFQNGYYEEMVSLIRGILGNVLKTNNSLKFAVLTGCLRIAKESVFTGLNNFTVYSITDVEFDEYFGFTASEVHEMLHYYGQEAHAEIVKAWYDGYHFGNVDIYCPWDVINYCRSHLSNPSLAPQNYWANTSGNTIIHRFITSLNEERKLTKTELEQLINGGTVQKEIHQELTYKELYTSMDYLWSALFMTGYLTQSGESNGNRYNLMIPNEEIRNILTEHVLLLFREDVQKDGIMVNHFCNALLHGDAQNVEALFTEYMQKTISVRDTFIAKSHKENFYHGLLLGILSFKDGWTTKSNRESGDGFSDIMIIIDDSDTGIIIEIKYADDGANEKKCKEALDQIILKNYVQELHLYKIKQILKYGISCNRKSCKVIIEKESNF